MRPDSQDAPGCGLIARPALTAPIWRGAELIRVFGAAVSRRKVIGIEERLLVSRVLGRPAVSCHRVEPERNLGHRPPRRREVPLPEEMGWPLGAPPALGPGRWRPVLGCWSCPCLIFFPGYSYTWFHIVDYLFRYMKQVSCSDESESIPRALIVLRPTPRTSVGRSGQLRPPRPAEEPSRSADADQLGGLKRERAW